MRVRHRNYCFTWNNYQNAETAKIALQNMSPSYCIYGFEIAPTTGTPHLQGYMEFDTAWDIKTLQKMRPGVHWSPRKGTQKQAVDYCKKDNNYVEWGTPKKQGERRDLNEIRDAIVEGASMYDIATNHFGDFMRYHKGFEKFQYLHIAQEMATKIREIECQYWWGPTRSGKTRAAWELLKAPYILNEGNTGFWWTGYMNQENILIDDFRGTTPLHILLRWLDRYPVQVPCHGGYHWLCAKKIIITSNVPLESLYRNCDEESRKALRARFAEIRYIGTEVSGNNDTHFFNPFEETEDETTLRVMRATPDKA